MKRLTFRQVRNAASFLVAGLAVGAALYGCGGGGISGGGGGGSAPPGAVQSLDRSARLVLHVTRDAPRGYLAQAPAGLQAKLEQQGFVFRDNGFDYPDMPLEGRYLKLGNKFIGIGTNGEVHIPQNMPVTGPVAVYGDLSDTQPMGMTDVAPALSSGSAPLSTVALSLHALKLGSAAVMDGKKNGAGAAVKTRPCCQQPNAISDGCKRVDCDTTVNDPSVSCCLDFDTAKGRIQGEEGEDGDGIVPGPCTAKRLWEYLGTVCDVWVRRDVCLFEAATGLGPFGCYRTHRYRYCQFLNEKEYAVTAPPSPTVEVGSTLAITVTNNTPANETLVDRSGDANGTIQPGDGIVAMSSDQYQVQHYNEAAQTHLKDKSIVYAAPASLPDNKTEAYDTLTFDFWGKKQTLTIRVVQKCGGTPHSKPREVPCGS